MKKHPGQPPSRRRANHPRGDGSTADGPANGPHARPRRTITCIGHEWVVYSTAVLDGWLMLQCVECGAMGTIDDPSAQEWGEAYHAPNRPYRWQEESRVHVRGTGPPCVIRTTGGPRCDCQANLISADVGAYERLPVDFVGRPETMTSEERNELVEFAGFVSDKDLCSRYFPLFVLTFELKTGSNHSPAVHAIAERIEAIHEGGLHCSPTVVAAILMWAARVGDAVEPL
jgi:hypothetical protein